ncbi:YTH domain-containing protein ECT4-like [Impatiens glandulifera]|uniref:YTH domain-containing protein ECT4-like n=1 Tax=Impatiens glandulifera TaxID=253017 RepID=UPI001FB1261B|nr:YTH domain-containing protein ECT4-like [Impatiens glandulifera]
MTNPAPPADQTVEYLQKLTLDSESKPFEVPNNAKKYSSVNSGILANGLNKPFERSSTPSRQDFVDPGYCFLPNAYPSPIYYGGGEWDDYSYANSNGVDVSTGAYNNNGSLMYQQGYGYAPYGAYHAPGSPVPTMVHDGQIYGPQHYQYPSYYPSSAPTNGSYAPNTLQAGLTAPAAADQVPLPLETVKVNSNATNAGVNSLSVPKPHRPNYQNSFLLDASVFPDGKSKHVPVSHGNNFVNGRNPNLYPFSHLTPRPNSSMNQAGYDRMYPNNRIYGQYGNMFRTGGGYGIPNYERRINGRGWMGTDNRYKPRGRANGSFVPDSPYDGLNELNRGPRAKGFKNSKDLEPATIAMKGQTNQLNTVVSNEEKLSQLDLGQYNTEDFPEVYKNAKFFIIKSYSEDDVHKSIKYGAWASTPNGNKKLDAAYREAQEVADGCPVFLFFSVNASGQFVGVTEMLSAVDFDKSLEYWQQDKWTGYFPVKWHIVKDIPNSLLKHIILANNEDKPVTNSRDTQEVKLEQGIEMLKIFKSHPSKTCILDDFVFYEARQKIIQEKKAKQQQFNKRVGSAKVSEAIDGKERIDSLLQKSLDVASPVLVEDPAASDGHQTSKPALVTDKSIGVASAS